MEDMAIPEIPPSAMEGAWLLPSGAVSGAPIGISDASGNICFAPCLGSTTWYDLVPRELVYERTGRMAVYSAASALTIGGQFSMFHRAHQGHRRYL